MGARYKWRSGSRGRGFLFVGVCVRLVRMESDLFWGRIKERRRGNVGNSTRITHVRIDFGLAFCELYIGLVGDLVHGEFAAADDLAGVAVTVFEIS